MSLIKRRPHCLRFYFYRVLNLYFVALVIPPPFQQWIDEIRMEMADKFNCRHALKTVPHITLQPPFKSESAGTEILNCLKPLSEMNHPLCVSTTGFDSFDNRVAFIDVKVTDELKNTQRYTHQLLAERKIVPLNCRPFHPHITLAHRDLNPVFLPEIKHLVEQKEIKWMFEVNAVTLLIHQNGKWQSTGEVSLVES